MLPPPSPLSAAIRGAVFAGLAGVWAFPLVPTALAQVVNSDLWGTNRTVTAIARSGDILYIGGSFNSVGRSSGSGVPVQRVGGAPLDQYPKVAGSVAAVAPDGTGGWYIGGTFTAVGGLERRNLARIMPDGSVGSWDPSPNGNINGLTLVGSILYVAGGFTSIAGEARQYIASIDTGSGLATAWDPSANSGVWTILGHGDTVYVGGAFSHIGGQQRNNIAALDASTGVALDWDPDAGGYVRALAIRGNTLYAGGAFDAIGGQSRKGLAALDVTTGIAMAWNPTIAGIAGEPDPTLFIASLALGDSSAYVSGHFAAVGGQARGGVAELDLDTGAATAWNPNPLSPGASSSPYIFSVAEDEGYVYVAGRFTAMGGQTRFNAAAIDVETGTASNWDPRPNGDVLCLALSGGTIYAGGTFDSIWEWQIRNGIAALNATTGTLTPWNPNMDGFLVRALAVSGNTVYAGGNFSGIGGQPRSNIAALDATTGLATDWNPSASGGFTGGVFALVANGGLVYAAGDFTSIGGQARGYLAALDALSGAATDWNPNANDIVNALALDGQTLYAGGWFSSIGGQARSSIAALDVVDGSTTTWDPGGDGVVNALAVHGRGVYAGGVFRTMGGQSRNCLAALDATTGLATAWNPDPSDVFDGQRVIALAMQDSTLFVGGRFDRIGGADRVNLAGIDIATGSATAWNPDPDGYVWSLLAQGGDLHAGGGFTRLGVAPTSGLVGFSLEPGPPPPGGGSVALAPIVPNPVQTDARIRFVLPSSATVSLEVFDLQGRRVALLLNGALREAGTHDIELRTAGWPPGFYFCRLRAGSVAVSRKLLLVK